MARLELAGMSKTFGGLPVLSSVDLAVDDGSTMALLGPSGSGKSTLLRLVAGLDVPDAGTVRLDDRDVTAVPAHRRGVAVVFQDQALFPHFDVAGNVGFGLRMAGVGRADRARRVSAALEMVGLAGYERRDPATLSGGEAQRVAIARALAPEPEVLLLDEPLSGLDQLLRERLLLELRSVFDGLGVTVIAVTHDPTEASVLGDRMAVLVDGSIAQVGVPGEVLARPVSGTVAGLVGHRNVAPAVVAGGVATCPWVQARADDRSDGPAAVLVPPDAVRDDVGGELVGVVTGILFRGGTAVAVVAGDAWPPLDVPAEPGWRVGDQVTLSVEPSAVRVLDT